MKPLKFTLATAFIVLTAFTAKAQRFELGVQAGGVNYVGDLVTHMVSLKESQPGAGIWGRYYINRHFSTRFNMMYGSMVGDDKKYPNVNDRYNRNLSFHSHIFDAGLVIEADLISFFDNRFDIVYRRKEKGAPINLNVFMGVCVFNFNPKTYYQGEEYALQPLQTELQKPNYALTQIGIPLGASIAWKFNNGWRVGFEMGYRLTFTDYLDDVSGRYANASQLAAENRTIDAALSNRTPEVDFTNPPVDKSGGQRGNPGQNDGYVFTSITLSHNLNNLFGKNAYKSARHKPYKRGRRYKTGKGYKKFN